MRNMHWKWHVAEASILLIVALLNSLWIDYFFDPLPSIYITGIVQAIATIVVLFLSKFWFRKRYGPIIRQSRKHRRQK